jgi:hypothetical protein
MEIDTSKLTDEQISKLSEYVHKMEEENKKSTKWWIMPRYSAFTEMDKIEQFGQSYYVEPEQDLYSKSKPPLKSGFESKEAAEKWLKDYLAEEDLFSKARDEIGYLKGNLEQILARFNRHEYLTNNDWTKYFKSFDASMDHGTLKEVTKE